MLAGGSALPPAAHTRKRSHARPRKREGIRLFYPTHVFGSGCPRRCGVDMCCPRMCGIDLCPSGPQPHGAVSRCPDVPNADLPVLPIPSPTRALLGGFCLRGGRRGNGAGGGAATSAERNVARGGKGLGTTHWRVVGSPTGVRQIVTGRPRPRSCVCPNITLCRVWARVSVCGTGGGRERRGEVYRDQGEVRAEHGGWGAYQGHEHGVGGGVQCLCLRRLLMLTDCTAD